MDIDLGILNINLAYKRRKRRIIQSSEYVPQRGGVGVRDSELATFCKELAIMVRAGMTLEETIEFMEQDSEEDYTQQVIKKIKVGLRDGKSIDKALQNTQEFPVYILRMIKIGLLANRLGEVLEVLSKTYLREARLKENLKRALNYPVYLGSVLCIVMIFLVIKVMPIFDGVFITWTGELVQAAKGFMKLGKWVGYCTIGIFVGMITFIIVGALMIKTKRGREIGIRVLGCTNISERIDTARFARVMGIVLKGGFNLEESLQKSLLVVENKTVQQRIKKCIQMVAERKAFENALVESKIFSRVTTRLVVSGFANGQLQEVMKQVGEESERNVQYALENKVWTIETISIGVTSVIIGSVLVTVMLSLMSIIIALI